MVVDIPLFQGGIELCAENFFGYMWYQELACFDELLGLLVAHT